MSHVGLLSIFVLTDDAFKGLKHCMVLNEQFSFKQFIWKHSSMTSSYLRPERLREATMGDANVALQELHHREGERELIGSLFHLRPCQGVLHHELRQVTHDL